MGTTASWGGAHRCANIGNRTSRSTDLSKKTKRTRRRYSPDFKANAVKLAMQGGVTIASVARDLGVHEKSLYEWVASAKKEADGGLSFSEREELAKLREIERRARDLVTAEHMPILDVDQCRRSLVEALRRFED